MAKKEDFRTQAFPAAIYREVPTNLSAEGVRAITGTLTPSVADAFATFVKTKNGHRHRSGSRKRDLHLLFDEQAEAIFASTDPLVCC